MRQIIALTLVSVFAFLGIILIKEYRLGQIQDQKSSTNQSAAASPADSQPAAEPTAPDPKPKPEEKPDDIPEAPPEEPVIEVTAKAPEAIIGTFAIDKALSQQSLVERNYGTELDAEALITVWPLLLIDFDGKVFKIDDGTSERKQYFQPIEQSDKQLTIPLNLTGNEKPVPYVMTWDEKGFWLAYPVKKPGGEEDFEARIRFKKIN